MDHLDTLLGALIAGLPTGIGWFVQHMATRREREARVALDERNAELVTANAELSAANAELVKADTRLKNLAIEEEEMGVAKKRALAELEFDHGVYWDKDRKIPYCPVCFDCDRKIPLQRHGYDKWRCPTCSGQFDKSSQLRQPPPMPGTGPEREDAF